MAIVVAITQAAGGIQILLATFATVFPIGVASAFFYIVWHKPQNLYGPGDYTHGTSVTSFVEALSLPLGRSDAAVELAVRSAVEAAIDRVAKPGITQIQVNSVIDQAVEVAKQDLARRTIEVEIGELDFGSAKKILTIPVEDSTRADQLLNRIWFGIKDRVPAYTYGKAWVLVDSKGRELDSIGTNWAAQNLGTRSDNRTLADAGIPLDSKLSVLYKERMPV
ncbi:hypothetical protein [Catellatospora sichuanensis]|uniref:hypothetical protein n=1 Tax=Catellatospora sichuanensis TaxID=1969805 RepID=UPI001183717D|nr:hypothetical protein [Catellatospora sichuanensis]